MTTNAALHLAPLDLAARKVFLLFPCVWRRVRRKDLYSRSRDND